MAQGPSEGFVHAPSVNDVTFHDFNAVAQRPSEGFADTIDPREKEHGDNENQSALRTFPYVNGLWPRDQMGPQRGEIKSGLTPNPADGVTTTSNDGYVSRYVSSATAEPQDARQQQQQQQQQQPTLLPITEDDNTIETTSPHVTIETNDGRVMQVEHGGEPTTQQIYEDFMEQPRIQKYLNQLPTTFVMDLGPTRSSDSEGEQMSADVERNAARGTAGETLQGHEQAQRTQRQEKGRHTTAKTNANTPIRHHLYGEGVGPEDSISQTSGQRSTTSTQIRLEALARKQQARAREMELEIEAEEAEAAVRHAEMQAARVRRAARLAQLERDQAAEQLEVLSQTSSRKSRSSRGRRRTFSRPSQAPQARRSSKFNKTYKNTMFFNGFRP